MREIVFILLFLFPITNQAQVDYSWHSVPIGGGGYIIGMKIHPSNPELIYYRTDIGGAYRWDPVQEKMVQLIHFGEEFKDYYGVAGIALDPNDENKVILAVGRYCNLSQSAILVSNDQGESWTIHSSPVPFGSNGGRGCSGGTDQDRQGSPIHLNPGNPGELFIGSRAEGLWKLNLSNGSFSQEAVGVIPSNTSQQSIRNVLFHPAQSQNIFVGYAGHGIYMGNVNNGSYSQIDQGITDLQEVSDMSISRDGDLLFVACKDKGIYRCTNPSSAARVWEMVLPYTGTDPDGEAFLTVSCSPHANNTIITVNSDWDALDQFFVSTNSGNSGSWNQKQGSIATNLYPHKGDHGSHISQIAFDPVDPNSIYFTSWFTSYYTNDWTVADIQWHNDKSAGHEEVVATDIITFNYNVDGNFMAHAGADQTGFMVDQIIQGQFPTQTIKSTIDDPSLLRKGASLDVCFHNPDHIIGSVTKEWINSIGAIIISTDGGESYTRSNNYDESLGKSVVAIASSDPNRVVIANSQGVQWSSDGGHNFTQAVSKNTHTPDCIIGPTITPTGWGHPGIDAINTSVFSVVRPIAADKELDCTFYFYDWLDGSFHVSTNYGEEFFKVYDGLPKFRNNGSLDEWRYKTRIHTIPGHPQHVWINFNTGLYFSSDAGQNWTLLNNVQKGNLFGIGKAIAGASYPSIFLYGKANGDSLFGYYRSTNMGVSWEKINDPLDNENWGQPRMIQGDFEVEGRVYVGTSGLGVIYGDTATPPVDCQPFINLNNLPVFSGTYNAQDYILSNGLVPANQVTNFQAGNSIELEHGFGVDIGATFHALILNCN